MRSQMQKKKPSPGVGYFVADPFGWHEYFWNERQPRELGADEVIFALTGDRKGIHGSTDWKDIMRAFGTAVKKAKYRFTYADVFRAITTEDFNEIKHRTALKKKTSSTLVLLSGLAAARRWVSSRIAEMSQGYKPAMTPPHLIQSTMGTPRPVVAQLSNNEPSNKDVAFLRRSPRNGARHSQQPTPPEEMENFAAWSDDQLESGLKLLRKYKESMTRLEMVHALYRHSGES